jgi:hypothetical protein
MSSSLELMDRLRCLEQEVRAGLREADGARAGVTLAEYRQRLAEASQSLAPYDVQALLATQRELTSLVQKIHLARVGPTAFTFRKKQAPGSGSHVSAGQVGQVGQVGEVGEVGELDQVGEVGELDQVDQVDQVGEAAPPGKGGSDVCAQRDGVTSIDASALDPATSSLVVENRSGVEVRIRKLGALQQVRIRGCEHVTFMLYYSDGRDAADNDKIVVEDSRGLLFGFYDESDGACIPRRTVRDFGWLRAGPSPNVSWLDEERRMEHGE